MNEKYLLKTVDGTLWPNIPNWELTLTESDIKKIKYLKGVEDECDKVIGSYSGLRFSFDVTDSLIPKVEDSDPDIDIIDSRLEYIGEDKFQITIDLLDQYGEESVIFTEPFGIDSQKDIKLEGDDSIENLRKTVECLDKHVNEIKKILNELEGLGSVERSLLKWKILADIHEISESLKES